MNKVIFPGSFDPITNGHLDVVDRASGLFDGVIIAVASNDQKTGLFSTEEKINLIKETTMVYDNVEVDVIPGLLVDYAERVGARAIIRGLRAISDFEFEFQMALMNRKLKPKIETLFLMPRSEYTYVSSRIVREIARLNGDVSAFVPREAVKALESKFRV